MIEYMFEHEFSGWVSPDGHPTLFRTDRQVWVDFQGLYPGLGQSMTGVPLWCRSGGARLEPWMEGRQRAWLRRFRRGMVCLGACTDPQRQWLRCPDDATLAGAHTVPPGAAFRLGRTTRTPLTMTIARRTVAPAPLHGVIHSPGAP